MSRRRAFLVVTPFLLIIVPLNILGQSVKSCPGTSEISVDYDYVFPSYGGATGVRLIYGIQRPYAVSSAWVDIWDGALRLVHAEVPVGAKGDFKWMHLDDVPHTPSTLTIGIFDPDLPLFGDDPAGPSKGGVDYRSAYWSGSSPDERLPFSLAEASYQIQEQDPGGSIELDGSFIGPPTDILLQQQEGEGHWVAREYLIPQVLDRTHIQITIPERFLEHTGILGLSEKPDGAEYELGSEAKPPRQTIYVYSTDSPTLSKVMPSEISASEASEGSFHIPIHLHGSGFTPASEVTQSLYDHALGNNGRTRFISPNDLEFDLYKNEVIVGDKWSNPTPIRLWVVNGDWLHVSEPQEIRVVPSSLFPPDPYVAEASRIAHVSPDPVKLMDPAGPASLMLTIQGEHFRRGENVVATIRLDDDDKQVKLRTQFISATELRAWLPRELWSEHRLRYGFGVKTQNGICSVEIAEDEDN